MFVFNDNLTSRNVWHLTRTAEIAVNEIKIGYVYTLLVLQFHHLYFVICPADMYHNYIENLCWGGGAVFVYRLVCCTLLDAM